MRPKMSDIGPKTSVMGSKISVVGPKMSVIGPQNERYIPYNTQNNTPLGTGGRISEAEFTTPGGGVMARTTETGREP